MATAHPMGDPRRTLPEEIIPGHKDDSAERESVRLRREQLAREKQHQGWDKLLASESFRDYLAERGFAVRNAAPALPRAHEAEQAALGGMLIDHDAARIGLQRLRPGLLGQRLYHVPLLLAIAAVFQQSQQGKDIRVDYITVVNQLRRSGALEREEDLPAYAAALIELCPSSANINAYIDPIIETAQLRALFALGEALQAAALAHEAEPLEVINIARKGLDTIEQRGSADVKVLFAATK